MTQSISVILPVYNGALFVESAIRSIFAQEVEFEILAHDDGSTDETWPILMRLARQDRRLSITRAENGGPAAARNSCLARASGSLIAFLDHDDLWPRGRLGRQADLLMQEPRTGAVLGHTLVFEHRASSETPAQGGRSRRVLAGLLQAGLFRRAALDELGGFDTGLAAADDFDLLLRLLESRWSLTIEPEVAVFYRLHPGQWTADTRFASRETVRALHRSLQRRRASGAAGPLRRT